MNEPKHNRGRSVQEVCTPHEFLEALKKKLGMNGGNFYYDLAATEENKVTRLCYTPEQDSLVQSWYSYGIWNFCNPPYGDITPWVQKAYLECRNHNAHTAMLVPASVGSNWWRDNVDGKADVLFLNGRITFVGHNAPYPKDCAILLYAPFLNGNYSVWSWNND